jgi:hypothetical protein
MNFEQWLDIGLAHRWCGPSVCYTHDDIPLTESELDEFDKGDPCINIIRLYENPGHAAAVEQFHEASAWRERKL